MTHPAQLSVEQLLKSCLTNRQRRSGPGGQHRNKVETAINITHQPTGIAGQANESRQQERNRKQAIFRLRVNLAIEHRQPVDTFNTHYPSNLLKERIRGKKLFLNTEHADYPAILSEILDLINMNQGDVNATAKYVGLSTTQITKLLKTNAKALTWVNALRSQNNMHTLR